MWILPQKEFEFEFELEFKFEFDIYTTTIIPQAFTAIGAAYAGQDPESGDSDSDESGGARFSRARKEGMASAG